MGKKNSSCVRSLGAGLASSRDCLLRSKTPLQYTAGCGCLHLSLCLDLIKSQIAKKTNKNTGVGHKKIQKTNVVLDVLPGGKREKVA